jgi:hypothetical protein
MFSAGCRSYSRGNSVPKDMLCAEGERCRNVDPNIAYPMTINRRLITTWISGERNWRHTTTNHTTTVIYDINRRLTFISCEVNRLLATSALGLNSSNIANRGWRGLQWCIGVDRCSSMAAAGKQRSLINVMCQGSQLLQRSAKYRLSIDHLYKITHRRGQYNHVAPINIKHWWYLKDQ